MLAPTPDWSRVVNPLPCTDCRSERTVWVRDPQLTRRVLGEAAPRLGRVLRADGTIDGFGGRAAECAACGAVAAYPTEAVVAPRCSVLGGIALGDLIQLATNP